MKEFKFEEHNFEGKLIFIIGNRRSGKTTLAKDFLTKNYSQEIGIINGSENVFPEFTNLVPNCTIYKYHSNFPNYKEKLLISNDCGYNCYHIKNYILSRKHMNKTTIFQSQYIITVAFNILKYVDYYFICIGKYNLRHLNILYHNLPNFNIDLFNETFVKCLQNNLVLVIKRCARDGEEQIFWYKVPNPKYIEAYPQIRTIQNSVRNYLSRKKENSQLLSNTLFNVGYNPDYTHSFMYKKSLKNFASK